MEIYSYPQLDEQIQAAVLPNGLRIYCVPRADSEKTFAMLAADFGSIDCHFTIDDRRMTSRRALRIFWSTNCLKNKTAMRCKSLPHAVRIPTHLPVIS